MNTDDIKTLCRQARDMHLNGSEILYKYSHEQLARIYNGAGPESWTQCARDVATWILCLFSVCFLIHDVRFKESDGRRDGWIHANIECEINMVRVIAYRYPLLTWKFPYNWFMRRRWTARAMIVSELLNTSHGYDAWLAAAGRKDD